MIFKKVSFLLISSVVMGTIASTSFADNASTCEQYLNYSDSQFISLVSDNSSTANAIAKTLTTCQSTNVCADINDINNCASLLATREFESTYYANFTSSSLASKKDLGSSTPPSASRSAEKFNSVSDNDVKPAPSKTSTNSNNNNSSSIH